MQLRSWSWAGLTCRVATASPPGIWVGWSPRRSQRSIPVGWRPLGCWEAAGASSTCCRWAVVLASSRVRSRGLVELIDAPLTSRPLNEEADLALNEDSRRLGGERGP
jgi:hypothetical protein